MSKLIPRLFKQINLYAPMPHPPIILLPKYTTNATSTAMNPDSPTKLSKDCPVMQHARNTP